MSEPHSPNRREESADALRDVFPVMIAVLPFGGLFAALAVGQNIPVFEVLLASATIFAGASQYAALDLLGQNVPYWAIVLTVFAVNFRHILYSANIGRAMGQFNFLQKAIGFFFLMDPLFASAEARRRKRILWPSYYFTYGVLLYCSWMVANIIGAVFGTLIEDPTRYGFDMILPIYFLGLTLSFRKVQQFWMVVLVSGFTSLAIWSVAGAPWHITLGGVVGIAYAAIMAKPKTEAAS